MENEELVVVTGGEEVTEPEVVVSPRSFPKPKAKSPVMKRTLVCKEEVDEPKPTVDVDYGKMTPKEQQDTKTRFTLNLDNLRNDYPTLNPPKITEEMSVQQAHDIYEFYLNKALAMESVGYYTVFLYLGLMLVQWIVERIFRIDMTGFAEIQMKSIRRYKRLLIKLGEQKRINIEADWGPFASLCILVCLQVGIFALVVSVCGDQTRESRIKSIESLNNAMDGLINNFQVTNAVEEEKPLHERTVASKGFDPSALLGNMDMGKLLGGLLGGDRGAKTPPEEFDQ